MPPRKAKQQPAKSLEATLWDAADELRGKMDSASYKHIVLGLIFLKYVSDTFKVRHDELSRLVDDPASEYFMPTDAAKRSVLEDRDEYRAEGVFWIPEGHRWEDLRRAAKQPDIGKRIDDAMDAIERENPSLRGVLPRNYTQRELVPEAIGGLIDTFSRQDLASAEYKDLDVLGRVYEYFLGQFAGREGKKAGEFFTPRCVVQLLVEMLQPFHGRVLDPACGSGGMFVQADKFVQAHGGTRNDISVFGQESNPTTWRLAMMNLAVRGIEGNLGAQWGDSFLADAHPDLKADFVLANPPFNDSKWGGERLRSDPPGPSVFHPCKTPTTRGCSTFCGIARRRARWAPCWRTARCRPSRTERAISARRWSIGTWSSASSRCRRSCSTAPRFRPACGS